MRGDQADFPVGVELIVADHCLADSKKIANQREATWIAQRGPTEVEPPADARTLQANFTVGLKAFGAEHVLIDGQPLGGQRLLMRVAEDGPAEVQSTPYVSPSQVYSTLYSEAAVWFKTVQFEISANLNLLGREPRQVTPREAKGNDISFFEDDLFVEIAALEADRASYGYRFQVQLAGDVRTLQPEDPRWSNYWVSSLSEQLGQQFPGDRSLWPSGDAHSYVVALRDLNFQVNDLPGRHRIPDPLFQG